MATNRPYPRIPGHNVDCIDVAAGISELKICGYTETKTVMVIEFALMRWARGELGGERAGRLELRRAPFDRRAWVISHGPA